MNDFIVVGGGIAGISAAARLSHLGRVTVLEAEAGLGYHASGRSAAMFEQTYGQPSTIALNRASKDYHMTANGGVLSPRGLMLLGSTHDSEAFDGDLKSMEMHEISVADARAMVPILRPDVVKRVAYHAEAWDIDTDRLIQNFAREVRGNGGLIELNARVDGIERHGRRWQVRAGDRDWQGAMLVNAAGAWVDQVAAMADVEPLGFRPYRRSMARIPAPGGHDIGAWPMLFGPGEAWYAKPDAGKLLVSPADEDPAEPHDAWPEDMVLAEGLARYEAMVTEPVTRLEHSWAGLRTFAKDRSLVIGFDPADRSFFWVAGQGGYGFQTSPAASQLAADLVAGCRPTLDKDVVAALDPARFARTG